MIAILDQGQDHIVAGEPLHQGRRARPRDVWVENALEDVHRAAGLDQTVAEGGAACHPRSGPG